MPVNPIRVLERFVANYTSQREAATVLNIGESYLSDLLRGRRDCSRQILSKLRLRRVIVPCRRGDKE